MSTEFLWESDLEERNLELGTRDLGLGRGCYCGCRATAPLAMYMAFQGC